MPPRPGTPTSCALTVAVQPRWPATGDGGWSSPGCGPATCACAGPSIAFEGAAGVTGQRRPGGVRGGKRLHLEGAGGGPQGGGEGRLAGVVIAGRDLEHGGVDVGHHPQGPAASPKRQRGHQALAAPHGADAQLALGPEGLPPGPKPGVAAERGRLAGGQPVPLLGQLGEALGVGDPLDAIDGAGVGAGVARPRPTHDPLRRQPTGGRSRLEVTRCEEGGHAWGSSR